jgi:NAD-dependent deacetylase
MKKLVVLTGAGISSESGLKTFRDSDGLWEGHDVYEVASPMGWAKNKKLVLDFYNSRRHDALKAEPNAAHKLLAELEKNYNVTIITQNIDDLHERGGSTNVLHLHGEITKCRSVKNTTKFYPYNSDIKIGDLAEDGTQLRPHIVWFGEAVPMIEEAIKVASTADIFVVIGTSLQVYPAASITNYLKTDCKKFVIDKHIPIIEEDFIKIEEPATIGVEMLLKMLDANSSHL